MASKAQKAKPQPRLSQIGITSSMGGKVQIIQYREDSSFFVSHSETWDVPEGMTTEEVEAFRVDRYQELREQVDGLAQIERDERVGQSDWGS